MNSGGYYNGPVADWARQNIRGRVEVRPLFSSKVGRILTYTLLFCAPGLRQVFGRGGRPRVLRSEVLVGEAPLRGPRHEDHQGGRGDPPDQG